MNVLIVDDDSHDRTIISDLLEEIVPAVNCIVKESGEEAINYLRQPVGTPQLIFLDINMTGMDGKETLLKIKSMKTYARAKIIMYSATDDEREKIIYRKLGANGFLTKTASVVEMKSQLISLISTESAA